MRLIQQVVEKEALARWLFPKGHIYPQRRQLVVGDWHGNPGESCVIWLNDGHLYDFNGGRRGDLVDVVFERYAFSTFREVRQWLYSEGWLTAGAAHEPPAMRVIELVDLPCAPPRVPIPETNGIVHVYRWADGSIPLLVHRFAGSDGHKIIRRQTWDPEREDWYRRWNGEKHKWEWGTSTNARLPLYGLLPMLANPDRTVLIVEGEKTARAGALRWPGFVTVSPCGGSNPAWGTDWSPLAGRQVQVLGDADAPGMMFSRKVEYFAKEAGAAAVIILDPVKVWASLGGYGPPPKGWDIADEVR